MDVLESVFTEQILCTPFERDGKNLWLFRPYSISALWEQALGEEWYLVMYDDYYKDFWKPLFSFLDRQERRTLVVEMKVDYQWGVTPISTEELVDKLVTDRLPFPRWQHAANLEFVAFRRSNDQSLVIHLQAGEVGLADATD